MFRYMGFALGQHRPICILLHGRFGGVLFWVRNWFMCFWYMMFECVSYFLEFFFVFCNIFKKLVEHDLV